MSKGGKHAKGPGGAKMRVRKKKGMKMPKSELIANGQATVENRPATLADLKGLYNQVMDDVTRLIRELELKNRISIAKLAEKHDITQANQIVFQTMMRDANLIDSADFRARYDKYINETHGAVTTDGRMKGEVYVDLYRLGDKRVPTSTIAEHSGKGPALVIQQ